MVLESRYCRLCGQSLNAFGECNFCDRDDIEPSEQIENEIKIDASPLIGDDED